jgi:hypothetical protein
MGEVWKRYGSAPMCMAKPTEIAALTEYAWKRSALDPFYPPPIVFNVNVLRTTPHASG